MEFHVFRHAQYEGNVQLGKVWGRSPQMHVTNLGVEQAKAIRPLYDSSKVACVISSDALRTQQTAFYATGKEPDVIMPAFAEVSRGPYEGTEIEKMPKVFLDGYANNPFEFCAKGIESAKQAGGRFMSGLDEVVKKYDDDAVIWLFSHGNVTRSAIVGYILGNPESYLSQHLKLGNGSRSIIQYSKDAGNRFTASLRDYGVVDHIPEHLRS